VEYVFVLSAVGGIMILHETDLFAVEIQEANTATKSTSLIMIQ